MQNLVNSTGLCCRVDNRLRAKRESFVVPYGAHIARQDSKEGALCLGERESQPRLRAVVVGLVIRSMRQQPGEPRSVAMGRDVRNHV